MSRRWGLYFLVVGLTLSALGATSLAALYSWKVEPVLERDLATQKRHQGLYEDDLQYLSKFEVFDALHPLSQTDDKHDAGQVLNLNFAWVPGPVDGPKLNHVDPALTERLIRLGMDWITLAGKQKASEKYSFPAINQLEGYDYWDIEAAPPIRELIEAGRFVPPQRLPIPDPVEIVAETKLNLIRAAQDKSYLAALTSTRKLAKLLLSTENIQLVLAGLSVLDSERRAYRYYVDEKGFDAKAWIPVDRNVTRRAHRVILATRGYLRMWTEPEILDKYFLGEKPAFAFCAVVNEAFPLEFSLRRVLEPHLPGEMDFRPQYAKLDEIFARARTGCRLKYLAKLVEVGRFANRTPGPLVMNRLPYARKVFAMRLSTAAFGGFEEYDKADTGHNPASD